MRCVSVREARDRISRLLEAVEHGEEIMISRHGKPVARLMPVARKIGFTDRSDFRNSLSCGKAGSGALLRGIRDDERY
jgi:prevent-host-death family protein